MFYNCLLIKLLTVVKLYDFHSVTYRTSIFIYLDFEDLSGAASVLNTQ